MTFSTKTATNVGLLVAVSIILTRVLGVVIPVGGVMALRLSFGEIPLILAGVLFGPAAGAVAGASSDLIGFMVNSHGGPYFPGFTVSAVLTGMLPGLFLYPRRHTFSLTQLLAVIFLTDMITGVLLNTLWLSVMMDTGFWVLLPPRVVSRLATIPVYTAVVYLTRRAYQASQLRTL